MLLRLRKPCCCAPAIPAAALPQALLLLHPRSPAVPPVDALRSKIKSFVDTGILGGHPERLWVNPDCGLKTRDWPEACPPHLWWSFPEPWAL